MRNISRKIAVINFTAALALTLVPQAAVAETAAFNPQIDAAVKAISEAEILQYLSELSGAAPITVEGRELYLGERNTFGKNIYFSQVYLEEFLKAQGVDYELQPFSFDLAAYSRSGDATVYSALTTNVVAVLPGADGDLGAYDLYVGHYDSHAPNDTGYQIDWPAPGVTDNASAVVSLMVLIKVLRQFDISRTVKFAFVSAEEQGLFGSRLVADTAARAGDTIYGVYNLEMLAIEKNQDTNLVSCYQTDWDGRLFGNNELVAWLIEVEKIYNNGLEFESHYQSYNFRSDHFGFWLWDYPAIMVHGPYGDPQYHTRYDDVDHINIPYLTRLIKGLAATAIHRALGDERPAGYEEIPESYYQTVTAAEAMAEHQEYLDRLADLETDDEDDSSGCSTSPTKKSSVFIALLFAVFGLFIFRVAGRKKKSAAILLLGAVALAGCGSSEKEKDKPDPGPPPAPPEVYYLLDRAEEYLADDDLFNARAVYQQIIEVYHSENPQANFGLVLIDYLELLDLLSGLLGYLPSARVGDPLRSPKMQKAPVSPVDDGYQMAEYVRTVIKDLAAFSGQVDDRLQYARRATDFTFYIPEQRFRLGRFFNVRASGIAAGEEVELMSGVAHLLAGAANFLLAHNLEGDFGVAQMDFFYAPSYIHLVGALLNRHPELGSLLDEGPQFLETGRADLVAALRMLRQFLDGTLNRPFDEYRIINSDPKADFDPDDDEPTMIMIYSDPGEYEASDRVGDSLLGVSGRTLDGISALIENLEGERDYLGWAEDILPAVLPVVAPFLPEQFADLLSPELILTLVPDFFAINPLAFFQLRVGIRSMLPLWKQGEDYDAAFLFEWECAVGENGFPTTDYSLTCPPGSALADAAHFSTGSPAGEGGAEPIAADEIKSGFPYLPLPDPSFSGLLLLDLAPYGLIDYNGRQQLHSPDNFEINYAIGKLYGLAEMFMSRGSSPVILFR